MLLIAINKAEHVCAAVIIKHNCTFVSKTLPHRKLTLNYFFLSIFYELHIILLHVKKCLLLPYTICHTFLIEISFLDK